MFGFGHRDQRQREEFPAEVYLGGDGIGRIVVIDVSLAEAHKTMKRFAAINRDDVDKFFAVEEKRPA